MPDNAEIIERTINDFQKVQRRMMTAKRENAVETYAELKDDYVSDKVLLSSLGVNLTELDKLKE